jgi:hypothetical protein
MEFSPDEDIRIVLDKSATEAQPKADGTTLSRRAELRVRPNTVYMYFFFHPPNPGLGQAESQASEIEGKTEENQGEESSGHGRGEGQEVHEDG